MKIFLLNDTRGDRHHGCSIVMRNLIGGLEQRGATITGSLGCGRRLEQDPLAATAMAQAGRIVINGEGTLHHDRPYARYLLEAAAPCVADGKPVYLLNASWEENSPAMTALLHGFSGIWVRDRASAAELAAQGVNATVVPDLTFLSAYTPAPATSGSLLVTDSVFADTSERLQSFADALDARYLPIIQWPTLRGPRAAPEKWLKAKFYGVVQRVTLHSWRPRQYYVDLQFCETDTAQFLQALAGARAIVSGRYHATCLALQHRLPLVCLASNTRKVQNLLADAGLDAARHICSLDELATMNAAAIAAAADYTAGEKLALDTFLASARTRASAMLDTVAQAR